MAGFSMLEALIAIVILSLGLLGTAALQTVGLRASSSAGYRSQAAWLAQEMVEEARARRADVVSKSSDVVDAVSASACGGAVAGTSSIDRWRKRVACALPSGQGGVAYNSDTKRLDVTVTWDDSRGPDAARGGGGSLTFVIETVL
jgi:type IV pilus assembly protein PilV